MAKQASVQEAVGTAGQSRVTAQLDELGWGVVSNPTTTWVRTFG